MFKTTLVPAGELLQAGQSILVDEVVYGADDEVRVTLTVYPGQERWQVVFANVIGLRVLDERDLPEFWWSNLENTAAANSLVYRVSMGGWRRQQLSGMLEAGVYGEVNEYLVGGQSRCVNVLSTSPPVAMRSGPSTLSV